MRGYRFSKRGPAAARPLPKLIMLLLVSLLLASCAHDSLVPSMDRRVTVGKGARHSAQALPAPTVVPPATETAVPAAPRPRFQALLPLKQQEATGTRAAAEPLPFSRTKQVEVAVDDMPLPDFINYLFGDVFQVNYIVDSRVKKSKERVTLNLNRQVTEYQLFEIVDQVLRRHRLAVQRRDGIFYIWQGEKSDDVSIGVGAAINDIPATVGMVKQIIPLKFANAANLLEFLPTLSGGKVLINRQENILVVTGTRDQVVRVMGFVNLLDRPAMRGRYVSMLRLDYWQPKEMVKKLGEILAQEGIPVSRKAGERGVYFNVLDRWGTILCFAAEKVWLNRVTYWVEMLDIPEARDESHFFLYFPQNSKARELGESLEKILGINVSGRRQPAVASGPLAAAGKNRAKKKPTAAKSPVDVRQPALYTKVKIAVDENRNALVIYATPRQYEALESLIKKLDTMPQQVLLEASIAEVTLTGNLQFGIEWYLRNTDNGTGIIQTLGGLGLGSGGLNLSLVSDSGKFKMLLNAMAQDNLVKILSSPRLTVRDGKNASFTVGTEVPIITSEATTPDVTVGGTSGIIRSVEYRSTGITLQVTPTIHARGVVTLELSQEVSEAQSNNTSDISSPIILNRSVTTEVVAGNGQTVLLAGLIKENKSQTVTKVPWLGELPLIGDLFKTTTNGTNRSELVIMITPYIINSTEQIDEMREAIFESFKYIK